MRVVNKSDDGGVNAIKIDLLVVTAYLCLYSVITVRNKMCSKCNE